MGYTNSSIVPAAMAGIDRETQNGNMSTQRVTSTYFAHYTGQMPKVWARHFADRVRSAHITQVIFSYSTPIAWFDREHGWIIPAVTYSATTSSKHQSQLHPGWNRPGLTDPRRVYVPWDATADDLARVMDQKMSFVTDRQGRAIGTVAGPRYVEGK